ncbi:MAG: hypothetical protein ABI923_05380, partial [bacterium]
LFATAKRLAARGILQEALKLVLFTPVVSTAFSDTFLSGAGELFASVRGLSYASTTPAII